MCLHVGVGMGSLAMEMTVGAPAPPTALLFQECSPWEVGLLTPTVVQFSL